jgi:hypothetical protein
MENPQEVEMMPMMDMIDKNSLWVHGDQVFSNPPFGQKHLEEKEKGISLDLRISKGMRRAGGNPRPSKQVE